MRPFAASICLVLLVAACSSAAAGPDLTPATPEQLALLRNAANVLGIQGLSTQPGGSFSFIVIGDNRSGDDVYCQVIAQINAYTTVHTGAEKPLFAIHTGDIVPFGFLPEWDNYARMREQLLLPVVHCRGNHELRSPQGAENFAALVGSENWTFDFAGCRFTSIDDAQGFFTDSAIALLQDSLAGPTPKRQFIFFHEPPRVGLWAAHAVKPDDEGGRGGEVVAAIAKAGATAVFTGHIHGHYEMDIEGIPYIISAGGGAPLRDWGIPGDVGYGFLVVGVQSDGVSWTWVPVEPEA